MSKRGGPDGGDDHIRGSRRSLRALRGRDQTGGRRRRRCRAGRGRPGREEGHGQRQRARRREAAGGDRRGRLRHALVSALADKQRDRVELALEGMTCASCAARIERKLNKLEGVEATVNFATERAAIAYDPASVDVERLIRTVEQTGYAASLRRTADQAVQPDTDVLFRRLLVAVLLTGPLTVLSMVSAAHFTHWR